MKNRKHTFTLAVTFDKACTESHALREMRDNIYGRYYTTQRSDDEPGEYYVGARSIKRLRRTR